MFRFFKHAPKAYWWTGKPNFGDALAPLLLARFADLDVEHSPVSQAKIASIGSILEHIPPGWSGHIVGSGFLREDSESRFDSRVKILALRGPLTAKRFSGEFALGDPGLLANELIEQQEKQWDIGILPHWLDSQLAPRFKRLIPSRESVKIINPQDDPITILKQISACKKIVTSSLHGMIVSDGFGIPRRVEYCKKLETEGGNWKFRDYSASILTHFEVGKLMSPPRNRVDDARFQIYDAYRELSRIYGRS